MNKKITGTEASSAYQHLELKDISTLLQEINFEDIKVALMVQQALPQLELLCTAVAERLQNGGRLFYIGAGTSGRLGILDAAEIPPTYGVEHKIIGVIAGGNTAIQNAVENAEDDSHAGWAALQKFDINPKDFLIGLAASGTTPFVIGALEAANKTQIDTGCVVCNLETPIARVAKYPVEVDTGAEYVTGSTRMKAGSAQKMVLNMISTTAMIKLGRVKGNKMVEMKLSNAKLRKRGANMLVQELHISLAEAEALLQKERNVKKAMILYKNSLAQ